MLDPTDFGYIAVYDEVSGAEHRQWYEIDDTRIVGLDHCGRELWQRRYEDLASRSTYVQLQDLRYAGGIVYFLDACMTYAKDWDSKKPRLVAL